MTAARGSVRSELRIGRPADDLWAIVGDPGRLAEWFPGVASCTVDGDERVVTTDAGLSMPEQLLTVDRLQRRFQYRITAPLFREHLSTVDVHDLGDGTSLVVYSVDAEPSVMALVLGGAAAAALERLRAMTEEPGR
ncbi:MAG: SRPBCC family protein [Acidobacteriota bacterium]|nr:SRPBCC family protein [Acidobacteriota bacterium]